jgi:hypothetical protein
VADQAHRLEPSQFRRLIVERIGVRECDSAFCANAGCVLHIRTGDSNVQGNGNWAKTPDRIVMGRQRVQSVMLCDRCATRVRRGDLTLQRDCAA